MSQGSDFPWTRSNNWQVGDDTGFRKFWGLLYLHGPKCKLLLPPKTLGPEVLKVTYRIR